VTARSHLLRRDALKFLAGAALAPVATAGMPTKFQLACMTLPYANFPLERALKGIASAGYKYVAWGTTHQKKRSGNRSRRASQ
jgi:hypothetical protein